MRYLTHKRRDQYKTGHYPCTSELLEAIEIIEELEEQLRFEQGKNEDLKEWLACYVKHRRANDA